MDYKKTRDPKAYARDIANLSSQISAIVRDPEGKVKDNLTFLIVYFFVLLLMGAGLAVYVAFTKELVVAVLLGMVILLVLFYLLKIFSFTKAIKLVMNLDEDSQVDCDSEGVIRNGSRQTLKVYWDSIRCIRVYKHAMIFIPKDPRTSAIVAPKENLPDVEDFLKENQIEMKIIR